MEASFVYALDAEIARLEADIAANPDVRVVKLSDLKALRERFYPDVHTTPAAAAHTYSRAIPANGYSGGRRRAPETEAALSGAREFITGSKVPIRTSQIFNYLRGRGITVPGTDPASNLSAMLSKSPEFKSHGRAGWTLAETADAPPDLPPHLHSDLPSPQDGQPLLNRPWPWQAEKG